MATKAYKQIPLQSQRPILQVVPTSPLRVGREAWFLLGLCFLARLVMAVTLSLSDDEAWYWALAQKPALSYYVHPPFSVWMIHVSTTVFGNNPFAVRLPALFCSSLFSWWVLRIGLQLGWSSVTSSVIAGFSAPLLFFGGILSGPDQPLVLFWTALMDLSFSLESKPRTKSGDWLKLGLFLGLGLLSKYTAALAIPAILLWFGSSPRGRRIFQEPGLYGSFLLAVLIFSPVLIWNAKNSWASFQFQFVERHKFDLNFRRLALSWLSQLFLFGPALIGAWFALMTQWRKSRAHRFLAIWALVPAAIFFIQPLFGNFKVHWPILAYIPALIYFTGIDLRALWQKMLIAGIVLSSIGILSLYTPLLPLFVKHLNPKMDISNDFYGWDILPNELASLPQPYRALPIVSSKYQTAAQAAFSLGTAQQIAIIPHNSHELADWGGLNQVPMRFLFLSDNRYPGSPERLYPGYRCASVSRARSERYGYLAKTILIELCDGTPVLR